MSNLSKLKSTQNKKGSKWRSCWLGISCRKGENKWPALIARRPRWMTSTDDQQILPSLVNRTTSKTVGEVSLETKLKTSWDKQILDNPRLNTVSINLHRFFKSLIARKEHKPFDSVTWMVAGTVHMQLRLYWKCQKGAGFGYDAGCRGVGSADCTVYPAELGMMWTF